MHVRPAHAVRLHDALGRAGGARRIDDVERPARAAISTGAGCAPSGASQSLEGDARRRAVERDARQAGASPPAERLGRCASTNSSLRAAVGEHAGQARRRRRRAPAARRRRRRAARRGTPRAYSTEVAAQIAIDVAGCDAVALQRRGDAVHQRVELAVGQRARARRRAPDGAAAPRMPWIRSATRPNSWSNGFEAASTGLALRCRG